MRASVRLSLRDLHHSECSRNTHAYTLIWTLYALKHSKEPSVHKCFFLQFVYIHRVFLQRDVYTLTKDPLKNTKETYVGSQRSVYTLKRHPIFRKRNRDTLVNPLYTLKHSKKTCIHPQGDVYTLKRHPVH